MSERAREEDKDAMRVARFREQARKRLNEEMRDGDDPDTLGLAVARERQVRARNGLHEQRTRRAEVSGWPHIYPSTQTLGQQPGPSETRTVPLPCAPRIRE